MRTRRSVRSFAALGVTVLCSTGAVLALGVATAAPAAAHASAGQDATDWRSRVDAIDPPGEALQARTTDLGQHLEVGVAPGHDLVVLGYTAEPYLRVDDRGTWQNERSPAVWLNRDRSASASIPARFDASAPPQWRRLGSGRTLRWHDHRIHHSPGSSAGPWSVAVVLDGRPASISGTLDSVPGPNGGVMAVTIGGAAAACIVAVGLLGPRRARVVVVPLAVILAVAGVVQLVGQWRASTDDLTSRLGAASYGALAIVAAGAVAVAVARRGTVGGAPAMLLGGVAIAIGAGFAHLSWLVHSQLPTQLAAWFARSVVAASVAAGVAFAALGAVGSLGPRRYEETGSVIDD